MRPATDWVDKILSPAAKNIAQPIGGPAKIRYAGTSSPPEWGLSDQSDDINALEADAEDAAEAAPRMRFQGIVEAEKATSVTAGDIDAIEPIVHNERRWNAMSRQISQVSRLTALFVFFSFMVGTPLGNYFAHLQLNGSAEGWNPLAAFGFETVLFAFVVPVLVLLIGYALSRMATMLNAAESIAAAAQQMTTPDITAARNADTVGAVVQGHMEALNEGLDGALARLASVESMIRDHVAAIELAGDAIEQKATGAVERVADERSRLMDLTESLNAHADSFAAAIAERAKASIEALNTADTISGRAEREFDERLTGLEAAAERALTSFESLRDALRDTDETMRQSAESIEAAASDTQQATAQAKAAADAAAESAARNAANVAASANQASAQAKQAADEAIQTATEEAERAAASAIEAAAEETAKIQDAAAKTIGDISEATKEAVDAARADAGEATRAAEEVAEAARKTSEAVKAASSDVVAASEEARKTSEQAAQLSEAATAQIEERNKALADARAALEKENARLEALIGEQRKRAERLADAISAQTERLSELAETQLREQQAAAERTEAEAKARADKQVQARAAQDKAAAEEANAAKQDAERQAEAEAQAEAQQAAEAVAEAERQATQKAEEDAKKAAEEERLAAERRAAKTAPELALTAKDKPAKDRSAKKPNGAARLEELARDIAERRPRRGSRRRKEPPVEGSLNTDEITADPKRSKGDVSWREILDAADDAAPLELGPASRKTPVEARDEAANAIRIISGLQAFTYELETRLYGDPPPALQERYDRGDRNVFANRLLRLNEADVKRRIRNESARDQRFEGGVHDFLQSFEKLLEDATTSETADEELEEYLSSPLGRVYLLIGATVGFA
ncbi:MAG: hypothetical protein GXP06_05030 [Alphaproteobacteria bacterium]|nr:hypothetical protein [Alphaproteobacteria bacterium]